MYCVFHHISGHLPRQIKFWSILIKKLGLGETSPLPLIGTKSQLLPKKNSYRLPLLRGITKKNCYYIEALLIQAIDRDPASHFSGKNVALFSFFLFFGGGVQVTSLIWNKVDNDMQIKHNMHTIPHMHINVICTLARICPMCKASRKFHN